MFQADSQGTVLYIIKVNKINISYFCNYFRIHFHGNKQNKFECFYTMVIFKSIRVMDRKLWFPARHFPGSQPVPTAKLEKPV